MEKKRTDTGKAKEGYWCTCACKLLTVPALLILATLKILPGCSRVFKDP